MKIALPRPVLIRALTAAALTTTVVLAGCSNTGQLADQLQKSGLLKGVGGALSIDEITAGLKEALSKGSTAVVGQLGSAGGFSADESVRIPLPSTLAKARDFAAKVGLDGSFNNLENKLNEAAELATPKAKTLFLGAIKQMSVEDAKSILSGPDDAATKFFESKTRSQLASDMRPIVDNSLSQVGAVNTFNQLADRYKRIPLAPKVDADLTGHVVSKGMDGIFKYLAQEEKAIRENPAARTTELLKKVFASQ
ncbi:MAG: DUF4197 domain-containing protein [Burkholderiaceae bacterium]